MILIIGNINNNYILLLLIKIMIFLLSQVKPFGMVEVKPFGMVGDTSHQVLRKVSLLLSLNLSEIIIGILLIYYVIERTTIFSAYISHPP